MIIICRIKSKRGLRVLGTLREIGNRYNHWKVINNKWWPRMAFIMLPHNNNQFKHKSFYIIKTKCQWMKSKITCNTTHKPMQYQIFISNYHHKVQPELMHLMSLLWLFQNRITEPCQMLDNCQTSHHLIEQNKKVSILNFSNMHKINKKGTKT